MSRANERWKRRGQAILKSAIRAASLGDRHAQNWLAGESMEAVTVAQMAGISANGLAKLAARVKVSAQTVRPKRSAPPRPRVERWMTREYLKSGGLALELDPEIFRV